MDKKAKIIAIVGMPGAGKTVAADFFRNKKIPVLRFGDQVDIGLKELGLPKNETNERWYREQIRQELGMAAMAKKIEPRIKAIENNHKIIVLDGLYSWEEFKYLKEKYFKLVLLCIYARPEIRYLRLEKRLVRPLTENEAKSRDIAEIEKLNKGGPIALADRLIINEAKEAVLEKELQNFYRSL